MTYRNVQTGETMDQDQYLVHQIERYMSELTTQEQVEWQTLYGKAAVKVWSAQNPDPAWVKEKTEEIPVSNVVLTTKEALSSPPPRRPVQETPPKKENSPPKRHREPENEKPVRMPATRKSELFNVPPKREAIVSSIPPPRQTSSFLPPPKRNAKMEDFTAGSATSTTRPPQRSALTPSVPPKRTFSEKPPTQNTEKTDRPVYTRDELWRMAREDPYYDETPTEDDGVYNRFAKMEFKTIFVVAALFVVCFVLMFTVVYVIMN